MQLETLHGVGRVVQVRDVRERLRLPPLRLPRSSEGFSWKQRHRLVRLSVTLCTYVYQLARRGRRHVLLWLYRARTGFVYRRRHGDWDEYESDCTGV